MKPDNKHSPLSFPCDFPIKIMGKNTGEFIQDLRSICLKHFPGIEEEFTLTFSSSNKFVSISLTVHASNKTQLDELYREITQHPGVVMAL